MRAALLVILAACAPPPAPATPAGPPAPDPDFAAARDPINTLDFAALHRKAQRIFAELQVGLPSWYADKVAGAKLDFDIGFVNAYASCADHAPIVTVTDELLQILARLAAARANEEIFAIDATAAYSTWMADHTTKDGVIFDPPQDREDPARRVDRRKLSRQHELFDESVAWVLAHELAHHYLNHLTCDGGDVLTDLRREAQSALPIFHQPDELAADAAGIANVLAAGQARASYTWHQDGALLLLQFFARQHAIGVEDVVFQFAMTHPPAQVRIPALKAATAIWYVGNGAIPTAIPYPRLPLATLSP